MIPTRHPYQSKSDLCSWSIELFAVYASWCRGIDSRLSFLLLPPAIQQCRNPAEEDKLNQRVLFEEMLPGKRNTEWLYSD
ncbi:hypothetical protein CEXT_284821 [Caerostris extrusa]|uniref:Uncharacterized protein n=1 Tax=Caerostris extrusa TaxID=172846 RepID=A0AAV4WI57_CAEEX|nr:hypothetical protein CEXT_284821 [Caerostris extrusa]